MDKSVKAMDSFFNWVNNNKQEYACGNPECGWQGFDPDVDGESDSIQHWNIYSCPVCHCEDVETV